MYHIYVVDDDLTVQRELKVLLENQGYRTTIAQKFTSIPEEIEDVKPDLILLDISLPSVDGIMLCAQIRMLSEVPIIFVHFTKFIGSWIRMYVEWRRWFYWETISTGSAIGPYFSSTEKDYKRSENILSFEDLELDVVAAKLKHYQNVVELSKNELHILRYFFEHKGEVVSREDLMNDLWDNESFVDDNTLSVNIKRIRNKLESIGVYNVIQTKRGMGYILQEKQNWNDKFWEI